jgi:hypothetical protein
MVGDKAIRAVAKRQREHEDRGIEALDDDDRLTIRCSISGSIRRCSTSGAERSASPFNCDTAHQLMIVSRPFVSVMTGGLVRSGGF